MKETEVNRLIIDKIKKLDKGGKMKSFLIEILNWEMAHIHEDKPRFTDDFIRRIEKYRR